MASSTANQVSKMKNSNNKRKFEDHCRPEVHSHGSNKRYRKSQRDEKRIHMVA